MTTNISIELLKAVHTAMLEGLVFRLSPAFINSDPTFNFINKGSKYYKIVCIHLGGSIDVDGECGEVFERLDPNMLIPTRPEDLSIEVVEWGQFGAAYANRKLPEIEVESVTLNKK